MKWKFKKECKIKSNFQFSLVQFIFFIVIFFRNKSNVSMIEFCKCKDKKIDAFYNDAEIAKTNYETLLNDDLATERQMRNEK